MININKHLRLIETFERHGLPDKAKAIKKEIVDLFTKPLQECVNDMGTTDDSAPYIAFVTEIVADNIKSMPGFNKEAYDELKKQFTNIRYTDTVENEGGGFEGMNFRNKKSSDGGDETDTSEDK